MICFVSREASSSSSFSFLSRGPLLRLSKAAMTHSHCLSSQSHIFEHHACQACHKCVLHAQYMYTGQPVVVRSRATGPWIRDVVLLRLAAKRDAPLKYGNRNNWICVIDSDSRVLLQYSTSNVENNEDSTWSLTIGKVVTCFRLPSSEALPIMPTTRSITTANGRPPSVL